jgi:hypothetical protein
MTIAQEITFAVLAAVGAAAGSEVIVVFQVPFYFMQGDGRGSAPLHLSEYESESAHRCRDGRAKPAGTLEVNAEMRLSTLRRRP